MSDPRSSGSQFSSEEFLARLIAREHEAVTSVVRAYTGQLLRTALGLGFDEPTGHELVQSAWVTFFDVLHRFEARSHVRTFLFGILYNKASELRRDHKRFDSKDPVEEVLESRFDSSGHWQVPPLDPEEFLMRVETAGVLEKCLEGLPMNQRMAFTLREVQELETAEVCQALEITGSNLGVLLYRARNRLRECIERKRGR